MMYKGEMQNALSRLQRRTKTPISIDAANGGYRIELDSGSRTLGPRVSAREMIIVLNAMADALDNLERI